MRLNWDTLKLMSFSEWFGFAFGVCAMTLLGYGFFGPILGILFGLVCAIIFLILIVLQIRK